MRRGRERDEITTMDGPWLRQTDPLDPSSTACLDRLRCRMGDHHPKWTATEHGPPGDVVSAVQWMLRIALGASGRWVPLQGADFQRFDCSRPAPVLGPHSRRPLLHLWRRESYTPPLLRGITQGLPLRRGSRLSSGNIRAWTSIEQAPCSTWETCSSLLLALVGS